MYQMPYNYQMPSMQPLPPPQKPSGQGVVYIYVPDPMEELKNCTGVLIRQQPEYYEAITGCETANRYHVFGQTPQGMKYLFKCREISGFCMRNCCPSNQREFNMDIIHIASQDQMSPSFTKRFANAFKPFKCPICCICRPEMFLTINEDSKYVGKVKHVCTFLDPQFDIYDSENRLKYIVDADCCQCGLCCANNLCGKLSQAVFNIYNGTGNNPVGTIIKKPANMAEMFTDADSYQVNFPADANEYDKFLMIALGLMIDYQYFETDNTSETSTHHYHSYGGYRRGPLYYGY